jgi:hypothetical protein
VVDGQKQEIGPDFDHHEKRNNEFAETDAEARVCSETFTRLNPTGYPNVTTLLAGTTAWTDPNYT